MLAMLCENYCCGRRTGRPCRHKPQICKSHSQFASNHEHQRRDGGSVPGSTRIAPSWNSGGPEGEGAVSKTTAASTARKTVTTCADRYRRGLTYLTNKHLKNTKTKDPGRLASIWIGRLFPSSLAVGKVTAEMTAMTTTILPLALVRIQMQICKTTRQHPMTTTTKTKTKHTTITYRNRHRRPFPSCPSILSS